MCVHRIPNKVLHSEDREWCGEREFHPPELDFEYEWRDHPQDHHGGGWNHIRGITS